MALLLTVLLIATSSLVDAGVQKSQTLRGLEATSISEDDSVIPKQILFTFHTDFRDNDDESWKDVMSNTANTINSYRDAWESPNAKVLFLTDSDCLNILKEVAPELARLFEVETRGAHKADMCRIGALYKHGGYFFDTDVQVVEKVRPEAHVSFVGGVACEGACMLTDFIASAPSHSIVEEALRRLVEAYKTHPHDTAEERPLSKILMESYRELFSQDPADVLLLLSELELDHHHTPPFGGSDEIYPHVMRQHGHGKCNIVLQNAASEVIYFFKHALGTGGCKHGVIPKQMWFSFKTNIVEDKEPVEMYNNIMNTVREYRTFWNDPEAPFYFLDDDACREMIGNIEPSLVKEFDNETVGAYKGDICRNAAMAIHGGYYFDVDMFVVEKVKPKDDTTFVSTWACGGGCFFQAFFAATPMHPIVVGSLKRMILVYKYGKDTTMLGPITMANTYFGLQRRGVDTTDYFELFEELRLDNEGPPYEHYPDVPRQQGEGNCNFIVHDPEQSTIYFFARFLGYGGCQPTDEIPEANLAA